MNTTRRRKLLKATAAAWLLAQAPMAARAATAAPRQLNVLTSYPDDVMARFEAAFEKRHPEYRIRFLWRMPHDALPYLEQPAQRGGPDAVDVYWAASPRTFAQLKREGLLQPLARRLDLTGLPGHIGRTQISDPDGDYLATEVAGYVFAYNEAALARLGVPVPADWPQLADARLLDQIALPVPSEVGFAPVMFDIVLQAYGWERGWALWSEIGALARLVHRGSSFIADQVGPGDVALGLSIDFFVKAAIAGGATLRQVYPAHNGINPGHVALPVGGRNDAGALAFARFVLSLEGQRLLAQPEIRKLAVRPGAYAGTERQDFDPFAAAARGTMHYDGARGGARLNVVSAVFDQLVAVPQAELRTLWQRVYAAERGGRVAQAVRALLSTPPVTEQEAESDAVRGLFQRTLEGSAPRALQAPPAWAAACAGRRAQAAAALVRLGA